MSQRNKTRNLLFSLRDREMNTGAVPLKLSLDILSQHIHSDQTVYECSYSEISSKPITYDFGLLYFNNYSYTDTIYGHACKPSKSHAFKPLSAKKKVVDVVTCHGPFCRTFDDCKCKLSHCTCASGFILCLTEDSWLCQYNLNTGALVKEVYVKCMKSFFKFKYCDWDEYASRAVVTSGLNYDEDSLNSDIVVQMAIFGVLPLEFNALFEIKRSVFGKGCKYVNVGDQLLILGMGFDRIHIYSFLDVMAQGSLTPYKIGEEYSNLGKIGMFPTGLPLNFDIETAPPLLFDVQCFGQSVCFGGYPFHCIYPKPKNQLSFIIQNLKCNSKKCFVDSNVWNDEPDVVIFHPDNSNRIILRELMKVCVYDIKYDNEELQLKESFSMEFHEPQESTKLPALSCFGRKIKRNWSIIKDRSIMATCFEDELDLFGILGVHLNDPKETGFVNLYDSATGKQIKSVQLSQSLCDTNYYQLYIDREMIIIIEKDSKNMFRVFTYQLTTIS